MSESTRNRLVVAALVAMGVVLLALVVTAPSQTDRVEAIGSRIKCPVCQGESIANSPADMARDMMSLVEERVAEGVSDEAIEDELLASYSGAVLLDPPASGNTLWLWLAPAVVLLGGVAVIAFWRRHPGTTDDDDPVDDPGGGRRLIGALILGGSFVAIVVAAGLFLRDDQSAAAAGVATVDVDNLDEVSNETLEAVIAANLDHPQIDGMRLALAERYFEVRDYRSAFPHYLSVAESTSAQSGQAVTALVRLGWMAWDGNGEAEAAIQLFDQASSIDSGASTPKFLKARVLWCGSNEPDSAAGLLEDLLADPNLPEESRALVADDLDAIKSGQGCP